MDTIYEIGDVAETSRLQTAPKHSNVLPPQCLAHKGGRCSTVFYPHPRSVSIEYSDYPSIYVMVSVVCHCHRLCKSFCLIINSPGSYRIYMCPIACSVRMDLRIS